MKQWIWKKKSEVLNNKNNIIFLKIKHVKLIAAYSLYATLNQEPNLTSSNKYYSWMW